MKSGTLSSGTCERISLRGSEQRLVAVHISRRKRAEVSGGTFKSTWERQRIATVHISRRKRAEISSGTYKST